MKFDSYKEFLETKTADEKSRLHWRLSSAIEYFDNLNRADWPEVVPISYLKNVIFAQHKLCAPEFASFFGYKKLRNNYRKDGMFNHDGRLTTLYSRTAFLSHEEKRKAIDLCLSSFLPTTPCSQTKNKVHKGFAF
jgi:hypothetical protein